MSMKAVGLSNGLVLFLFLLFLFGCGSSSDDYYYEHSEAETANREVKKFPYERFDRAKSLKEQAEDLRAKATLSTDQFERDTLFRKAIDLCNEAEAILESIAAEFSTLHYPQITELQEQIAWIKMAAIRTKGLTDR